SPIEGQNAMHTDTSAAEATLRDYAEAFARGDIETVVSLLHVPCVYITPAGVSVFPDAAFARPALSVGMEQMRTEGYPHPHFLDMASRVLSSDLVAFSGTIARIGTDGGEQNRVGLTY